MNQSIVDTIASKFGGQSALAEAIGSSQSTIAHWKRRGDMIPARQQKRILKAAEERKIALEPADFFYVRACDIRHEAS